MKYLLAIGKLSLSLYPIASVRQTGGSTPSLIGIVFKFTPVLEQVGSFFVVWNTI